MAFFIFTSCKYSGEYSEMKSLKDVKAELTSTAPFELTEENQKILARYSGFAKDLLLKIQTNSRMENYIHKKFFSYYQNSFCEEILIDKDLYDEIMDACTVNSFFICADDVKYFDSIVKKLYGKLTKLEKDKLSSEQACRKIIESYEL